MVFIYVVLLTAVLLLGSVAVAVFQQKKIKVSVIAREEVNAKDFFALRVESEDFLFVRDEMQDVSFIQGLDDVDDFDIKNLAEQFEDEVTFDRVLRAQEKDTAENMETVENVVPLKKTGVSSDNSGKLVMPKNEKKVS